MRANLRFWSDRAASSNPSPRSPNDGRARRDLRQNHRINEDFRTSRSRNKGENDLFVENKDFICLNREN